MADLGSIGTTGNLIKQAEAPNGNTTYKAGFSFGNNYGAVGKATPSQTEPVVIPTYSFPWIK